MNFREAKLEDIEEITSVRMSVKENILNNSALVTYEDTVDYLTVSGKGWVCETDNRIVGFAIVGLKQKNIWALFVRPEYESKGIGKRLHDLMMDWYFEQTDETVWLGTTSNTRAEMFYKKSGWKDVGIVNEKEIKFEMTVEDWRRIRMEK